MRKRSARLRLSIIIFAISFGVWLLHGRLFERAILTINGARTELVRQGLAVPHGSFDAPVYAAEERDAKRDKRGISIGSFISPKIWRAENPR